MSTRNFNSDYRGAQNTNSSGTWQYLSRSSDSSGNGRNPVSYSRQDYIRQDYVPSTRQDYIPPTRQDYVPPPRQDYGPSTRPSNFPQSRQNYVPPTRQDYVPPPSQDYFPSARRGNVPETRQSYEVPTRRDYVFVNEQDDVPQTRQNYDFPIRQDYVPPSRNIYGSYRQGFSSQNRQNTQRRQGVGSGVQSRQDYGFHNTESYVYQNRQDSGRQNRRSSSLQIREDYGPQIRQDYWPQHRRDYIPQNRQDIRPSSSRDFSPQNNTNYYSQNRRDYGSQRRSDYNFQSRQERGSDMYSENSYSSSDGNYGTQRYGAPSSLMDQQNPSEFRNYIMQNIVKAQQSSINASGSQNPSNRSTTSGQRKRNDRPSKGGGNRRGRNNIEYIPPALQKFCECCKVLCSGQKSYDDHLNTPRHKKQEQLANERATVPREPIRSGDLMCPICEIFCINFFSYRTHLRGSKHKQVIRMYKMMGREVPPCDLETVKAEANKRAVPVAVELVEKIDESGGKAFCKLCDHEINESDIIWHCKGEDHKINYVLKIKEEKEMAAYKASNPDFLEDFDIDEIENDSGPFDVDDCSFWEKEEKLKRQNVGYLKAPQDDENDGEQSAKTEDTTQKLGKKIKCELCNLVYPEEYTYSVHLKGGRHRLEILYQRKYCGNVISRKQVRAAKLKAVTKIPLVGKEYIVEAESESEDKDKADGNPKKLFCKLCECPVNSKSSDRHLRCKQHRLLYKEKVDPSIIVHSIHDERSIPWFLFVKQKQREQSKMFGKGTSNRSIKPGSERKPNSEENYLPTFEDRHITAKDESIYPEESVLQNIEQTISDCEEALKNACSKMSETICEGNVKNDNTNSDETSSQQNNDEHSTKDVSHGEVNNDSHGDRNFAIKAVVRIGTFAKDLILKGENVLNLVVLCEEIPTVVSLNNIYKFFSEEIKDKYTVNLVTKDATIVVTTKTDSNIIVNMIFTCTKLTEEIHNQKEKLINQEIVYCDKPLDALVQLRRIRWFRAKMEIHQDCIVVLRVLRAMCNENPAWSSLTCWVLELIIHSVTYKIEDETMGGIMRNFLEVLSSGVLLPDSYGICDPCEKEPTDATNYLSLQQRIDITTTAQFILRRMAFSFINVVLSTVLPLEDTKPIPSEEAISEDSKRKLEDNEEDEGSGSKKIKTGVSG